MCLKESEKEIVIRIVTVTRKLATQSKSIVL
jgi:hypothetical protein